VAETPVARPPAEAPMRKYAKAIVIAAVTSVVSCSAWFIAEYDAAVDHGAVQLQQKVDGLLDDLEQTAGTPEGSYDAYADLYLELHDDVETLRAEAATRRGNDLTLQSLQLIEQNLGKLERMHAEGITAEEIGVVRTLLDTQFRMLVQLENAKKRKEV
jgi:hypothetical protein